MAVDPDGNYIVAGYDQTRGSNLYRWLAVKYSPDGGEIGIRIIDVLCIKVIFEGKLVYVCVGW